MGMTGEILHYKKKVNIAQCFHFEGNFPNFGKSWFFPGNEKISGEFKKIENLCKHVEKYDFYGLKKQNL